MTQPLSRRNMLKWSLATAAVAGIGSVHARTITHSLPALDFAPDALEPHVDAATMTIHHTKHHAAYIAKLNEALATQSGLGSVPLDELMTRLHEVKDSALQATLRNNGGGHWNHAFFWKTLTPAAQSAQPSKELLQAIDASFGSLDQMKTAFADAAMKRFGSGWAWLISQNGKLKITSTPNQDNPLMKGLVADGDLGIPLLGLDVWEHAYYLHYQNRRADYVTAWWNVVNWKELHNRLIAKD
jgi:Fe-Mn family superoxide dismutase